MKLLPFQVRPVSWSLMWGLEDVWAETLDAAKSITNNKTAKAEVRAEAILVVEKPGSS